MKAFQLVFAACLGLYAAAAGAESANQPPVEAISRLDIARYMGRWVEIAKYPNRFQEKCVADTSAEYTLRENGRVRVVNRCRVASGKMEEAVGEARLLGGPDSAKLEVRFAPPWMAFLPFVWGNYWVIDLDPDYRLAAVSEPKREYLWILARDQQVDRQQYAALLDRLRARGFSLERLQLTPQAAAAGNH